MAIGIPFDFLNMMTQQIRVTLGIIYYHRGTYQINFDEFLSIMAAALQVEAGIAITKNVLERGAERIMVRMGSKTAGRLIPIVGAVIGGTTNYLFIKRMAETIKRMQPRYEPLTVHLE
jgi:F0F1-type ATP synthase beta subunit